MPRKAAPASAAMPDLEIWRVIYAAGMGTLVEAYDFLLFGSLATVLASNFFSKGNPTASLLGVFAVFAVGCLARPVGAFFFGRIGDTSGRQRASLLSMVVVALSTIGIGLAPSFHTVGLAAPVILLGLRLVQGFALGGDYGSSVCMIAEFARAKRLGFFTSFIQAASTAGLLLAFLVGLETRTLLTPPVFDDWGWRVPFFGAAALFVTAYRARKTLHESPLFEKFNLSGQTPRNLGIDGFSDPRNRRKMMFGIFGATAGQAVVWYTSHLYAFYFLQTVLHLTTPDSTKIMAVALLMGLPFFILFGRLSDRIKPKSLIRAGLLIVVLGYFPLYGAMKLVGTVKGVAVRTIEFNFNPREKKSQTFRVETSKDPAGAALVTKTKVDPENFLKQSATEVPDIQLTPSDSMFNTLVALVWIQVIIAALVSAPIAAIFAELMPVKANSTSLSLTGGLVPLIAAALVAATSNPLAGIAYPVAVASLSLLVGWLFLKEASVATPKPRKFSK